MAVHRSVPRDATRLVYIECMWPQRVAWTLLALSALASCGTRAGSRQTISITDSSEIKRILDADQADRESSIAAINWEQVAPRDSVRRKQVLEMIDRGEVRTGKDFARAALVFQHGETTNDILLAHILAVTALGKGDPDGRRMAAITLDRYLNRIGQPQVFGTQFNSANLKDSKAWTMDPYDPKLIGDALRALNCVEPVSVQFEFLAAMKQGKEPTEPPPVCEPSPRP